MSWRRVEIGESISTCHICYVLELCKIGAMPYLPTEPYQDLPPLPPAEDLNTVAVLKQLVASASWLARMDEATALVPNSSVLINSIPLLEAQASSEIENIVTTNDELFRAQALVDSTGFSPATKEALRYRNALHMGFQKIGTHPLTFNVARLVCSEITGVEMNIRDTDGTFIGNPATKQRVYTPPTGPDVIRRHMDKWEEFVNNFGDMDPLIAVALAHYQFEAIHPFSDGNGRTGRILNLLMLKATGKLREPVLYLSGYIVRNKQEYYTRLRAVTENEDWENWVIFILTGIEETASWTHSLIKDIHAGRNAMEDKIGKRLPAAPKHDLANLLFDQPYIRVDNIVEHGLSQRQTAARWLNELTDHKLLTKERAGRTNLYINQRFIDLLFGRPLPHEDDQ